MNTAMLLVGLLKASFGLVVGALLIFAGSRVLHRLIGAGSVDAEQGKGNVAMGVLDAGGLLALGLMLQHAVVSTFSAADLLVRDADITAGALGRVGLYAVAHLALSALLGALVLGAGVWLFGRLTRGVDEMAEIRRGNVAPAIVLSAVMLVLALLTAPGLEMALDGLLPLPALGRDLLPTLDPAEAAGAAAGDGVSGLVDAPR